MGEYHVGPLWRQRASPTELWSGVIASFVLFSSIGLIAIGLGLAALTVLGAPARASVALYLGLGTVLVPWTIVRPIPATTDKTTEQSWTLFVCCAVLVGIDVPRPVGWRVATTLSLGAGIAGFAAALAPIWLLDRRPS